VEAQTVRRAWELNVHVRARPISNCGNSHSFVTVKGTEAIVESVKPAEDGRGLILRVYEPHGARGEVAIQTSIALVGVIECNLVEEDIDSVELEGTGFRFPINPFQIRTFRMLT